MRTQPHGNSRIHIAAAVICALGFSPFAMANQDTASQSSGRVAAQAQIGFRVVIQNPLSLNTPTESRNKASITFSRHSEIRDDHHIVTVSAP